jgi:hypothetical protein
LLTVVILPLAIPTSNTDHRLMILFCHARHTNRHFTVNAFPDPPPSARGTFT